LDPFVTPAFLSAVTAHESYHKAAEEATHAQATLQDRLQQAEHQLHEAQQSLQHQKQQAQTEVAQAQASLAQLQQQVGICTAFACSLLFLQQIEHKG